MVNIVTDAESKKKQEALAQLLKKIEDEEETNWLDQFINACMLHANKDEESGEIADVEAYDAFIHFVCIGWKLIFSAVPPPHYFGGWGCFVGALVMIGAVTAIVG